MGNKSSYKQENNLPASGIRFQARDAEILYSIQHYDGVLSRHQIRQLFWSAYGWRAMARRLSKLHEYHYLVWPTRDHRRNYAIPEPIVWLGWRGAIYLAGHMGLKINAPVTINENQLRILQKGLRNQGFHWYREPRWNQLNHDLKLNDIRIRIEEQTRILPNISLEEWVNESAFRINMDTVEFNITNSTGSISRKKRGVCPDGMFTLINKDRRSRGLPYRARFLVELDLSTHDNPSFGLEKAAAGAAYIQSTKYRERFSSNNGRWLIITTGEVRMNNLIRQTYQRVKQSSNLFLFSTIDALLTFNPLSDAIWFTYGKSDPIDLLTE